MEGGFLGEVRAPRSPHFLSLPATGPKAGAHRRSVTRRGKTTWFGCISAVGTALSEFDLNFKSPSIHLLTKGIF